MWLAPNKAEWVFKWVASFTAVVLNRFIAIFILDIKKQANIQTSCRPYDSKSVATVLLLYTTNTKNHGWARDYVKSLNIMLKQTHIFIGNKGQNSFHNYTGNKTLSFLHQLEGA